MKQIKFSEKIIWLFLIWISAIGSERLEANGLAQKIQQILRKRNKINVHMFEYPPGSRGVPTPVSKRLYTPNIEVSRLLDQSGLVIAINHKARVLETAPSFMYEGLAASHLRGRLEDISFARGIDGLPELLGVAVVDKGSFDFVYNFSELEPFKLGRALKMGEIEAYNTHHEIDDFLKRYWENKLVLGNLRPSNFYMVKSRYSGRVLTGLPSVGEVVVVDGAPLDIGDKMAALKTLKASRWILNRLGYTRRSSQPEIISEIEDVVRRSGTQ